MTPAPVGALPSSVALIRAALDYRSGLDRDSISELVHDLVDGRDEADVREQIIGLALTIASAFEVYDLGIATVLESYPAPFAELGRAPTAFDLGMQSGTILTVIGQQYAASADDADD